MVVSSLFLDITGLTPSSLKSVKDILGSLAWIIAHTLYQEFMISPGKIGTGFDKHLVWCALMAELFPCFSISIVTIFAWVLFMNVNTQEKIICYVWFVIERIKKSFLPLHIPCACNFYLCSATVFRHLYEIIQWWMHFSEGCILWGVLYLFINNLVAFGNSLKFTKWLSNMLLILRSQ